MQVGTLEEAIELIDGEFNDIRALILASHGCVTEHKQSSKKPRNGCAFEATVFSAIACRHILVAPDSLEIGQEVGVIVREVRVTTQKSRRKGSLDAIAFNCHIGNDGTYTIMFKYVLEIKLSGKDVSKDLGKLLDGIQAGIDEGEIKRVLLDAGILNKGNKNAANIVFVNQLSDLPPAKILYVIAGDYEYIRYDVARNIIREAYGLHPNAPCLDSDLLEYFRQLVALRLSADMKQNNDAVLSIGKKIHARADELLRELMCRLTPDQADSGTTLFDMVNLEIDRRLGEVTLMTM